MKLYVNEEEFAARAGVTCDQLRAVAQTDDKFPAMFERSGVRLFKSKDVDVWLGGQSVAAPAEVAGNVQFATMIQDLLKTYTVDLTDKAKATSGIYLLYKAGQLIYIGQSVNVYSRIRNHRKKMPYDRVLFIPCEEGAMDVVESALIVALKPPKNGPPPLRTMDMIAIEGANLLEGEAAK